MPTYLPGTDCITYMTQDILCLVLVHVSIYKFKYIGECEILGTFGSKRHFQFKHYVIRSFRSTEGELSHKPYVEHNIT